MRMTTNQAKRVLERVTEFPDLLHNHPDAKRVEGSTATDDDRREAIATIFCWWNSQIVPVLTEIGCSRRRTHDA